LEENGDGLVDEEQVGGAVPNLNKQKNQVGDARMSLMPLG